MPDDPTKKGQDGKRISKQSHEQAYQNNRKEKSKGQSAARGNSNTKRSNQKERSR